MSQPQTSVFYKLGHASLSKAAEGNWSDALLMGGLGAGVGGLGAYLGSAEDEDDGGDTNAQRNALLGALAGGAAGGIGGYYANNWLSDGAPPLKNEPNYPSIPLNSSAASISRAPPPTPQGSPGANPGAVSTPAPPRGSSAPQRAAASPPSLSRAPRPYGEPRTGAPAGIGAKLERWRKSRLAGPADQPAPVDASVPSDQIPEVKRLAGPPPSSGKPSLPPLSDAIKAKVQQLISRGQFVE